MQKVLKRIMSFGLAALMCLGITAVVNGASAEFVVADAATDYYADITATGGSELLGQVHDLITTTHTQYTSYNDCKDPSIVKRTDPGTGGQLMEFYAQANLSSTWQSGVSGTWNREHVWCQSLSNGLWGTSGGGSDLYHIRPTESRVNSARGNNKYGVVRTKTEVWYRDANNTSIALAGYNYSSVFEPLDSVKGDVARIVMYMYTHYNKADNVYGTTNGKGSSNYFGTLRFTNIMSASSESAAIELLLEWHNSDPVDQIEITRNEAVYSIQGNRNPFVDHSEYADAIWGGKSLGSDGNNNEGGDVGDENNAKVQAFHAAVEGIIADGTLEERFASVNTAITAYKALSDADKTEAQEDIEALRAAVENYNQTVNSYNDGFEKINGAAVGRL